MAKKKKQRFEVRDHESVEACIERMKREGYRPVRRIEKPLFIKEKEAYIPYKQHIIFEGVLTKDEH